VRSDRPSGGEDRCPGRATGGPDSGPPKPSGQRESGGLLRRIRVYLVTFCLAIVFGWHTVVFVRAETTWMAEHLGRGTWVESVWPGLADWVEHLHIAFATTYTTWPVIAYCMDWLAYACIVLLILMLGAVQDPVRNVWIVEAFLIGCVIGFVMPLAIGSVRGIPLFWRLIDSSFGLAGSIWLLWTLRLIRRLEAVQGGRTIDPGT